MTKEEIDVILDAHKDNVAVQAAMQSLKMVLMMNEPTATADYVRTQQWWSSRMMHQITKGRILPVAENNTMFADGYYDGPDAA